MKTSSKGKSRIRAYEAYREWAYPDPGSELYRTYHSKPWGKRPALVILVEIESQDGDVSHLSGKPWTVGYGETLGVTPETRMNHQEALSAFERSLVKYEDAVSKAVNGKATQNEFDAMVSLCYNIGIKGFQGSTVCKAHNRGDKQAAARAFSLWNKSGGRVMAGLTARRLKESQTYLEEDFPTEVDPVSSSRVDPESSLARSPIIGGSTIAAGTGTIAVVSETASSVKSIRDNLGDWLPYVLVVVLIAGAGYAIYYRYKQRREGWA